MSELVLLHHNEPMTTSLAIADGTENTHAAVIKLVRKYVEDLQTFGPLGFEIQVGRPGRGGEATEYAYLNEPQATLLITYLRNTDVVRRFKIALVKAFYELRDRLAAVPPAPTFTTRQLDHGADLAVAADRTFRGFLRSARAAGLRLPQALKVANTQTVARTGMDMLSELGVDPDAQAVEIVAPAVDPVAEAVRVWLETAGEGPWRSDDILDGALGIRPGHRRYKQMLCNIGVVLRSQGLEKRRATHYGKLVNIWERKEA